MKMLSIALLIIFSSAFAEAFAETSLQADQVKAALIRIESSQATRSTVSLNPGDHTILDKDVISSQIARQSDVFHLVLQADQLIAQNQQLLDAVVRVIHAREISEVLNRRKAAEKIKASGFRYYGGSLELPALHRDLDLVFVGQGEATEQIFFGSGISYATLAQCQVYRASNTNCLSPGANVHWQQNSDFWYQTFINKWHEFGVDRLSSGALDILDLEFALGARAEDVDTLSKL